MSQDQMNSHENKIGSFVHPFFHFTIYAGVSDKLRYLDS